MEPFCDRSKTMKIKDFKEVGIAMFLRLLIAAFVFGAIASSGSFAQRSIKKLSDFPDEKAILAEAKRQHKRIIIEAESQYCHYCVTMKKKVIDAPEVSRILSRDFLLVSVDVGHSKLPFGLQKVYRRITPSFFFLDSDGKLLNHYPGSWTRHDFLQILEENRKKKGEN